MRLRPLLVAALALGLGLGLSGCGADAEGARTAIEKVAAPASDWTSGGQGIERFGNDAEKDGKIWVVDNGSDPTYVVGWEITVKAGFEGNRCEQAARWVKKTGQSFTGTRVDDQTKAKLTDIVVACLDALKPQDDGATATTGFASWPKLENDGYQFSASLGAAVTGSDLKLYAAVEAAPSS